MDRKNPPPAMFFLFTKTGDSGVILNTNYYEKN
jgi:hypothetical protein